MSDKVTVFARNVNRIFYIGSKGSSRSIFQRRNRTQVHAVKNASFVAHSGEAIGILGKNGSGKSTLLNMIAGNDSPTSGDIYVSAEPTLLGVSAALQSHLSGRENVKLGLLAMGLSPKEVSIKQDEVIDWAELTEAADRPLDTYSAGMKSRLKFSIATSVNREILMVDEALSTGDSTFNEKARARMRRFLDNAGTVFIVSHSAGTIEKHCTRAIWIHGGEIIADGSVKHILKIYRLWSLRVTREDFEGADRLISRMRDEYGTPFFIFDSEAAELLDQMENRTPPSRVAP